MINISSTNSGSLCKVLAVFLCLVWSAAAFPFHTVHKVGNINLIIHFQSGLSDISTETIKKQDILEDLSNGRPGSNDILAAVIDCNNPGTIYLIVWDKQSQTIVAETSMIRLLAVDTVINRKKKKDYVIALLDTEALFGSGYITASMKISKIKDKLIPVAGHPRRRDLLCFKIHGAQRSGFRGGR
jgi:hypothetical protein